MAAPDHILIKPPSHIDFISGETFLEKVFPKPLPKTVREMRIGGGAACPRPASLEKFLGEAENTSFKKGSQKYGQREVDVCLSNAMK